MQIKTLVITERMDAIDLLFIIIIIIIFNKYGDSHLKLRANAAFRVN